jgi:hypothetical protein
MFEKFITDIKNKPNEDPKVININPDKIVAQQSGELIAKFKDIDAMSEKETYELLKESYSYILADIFSCNNKEYRFLLTSPKFLTILTQVVTEIQLTHDELVHCNKFIYDYIVYADQDQYVRKLLFMLGEAVNKSNTRRLLGCGLDEELAIFLAVAHKSTFKEEVNIKRLNFTLATSNPESMSVQKVIDVYEALFSRIGSLFISTMFDITIATTEDAWITKEVLEANNNITLANLYILESMEPIEITRVLLSYAEEFKMVHRYDYKSVRQSLHNLPSNFVKTPVIVKQLEGDEILIP